MSPRQVITIPRACLLVTVAVALLLAGCSTPTPAPGADVPTSAPVQATSTLPAPPVEATSTAAVPTATPPPSPTLEPTHVVLTSEPNTEPTPAPASASLVSLREESLLIGDGWGAGSRQALSLGPVTSLAVHGSQIAYVANGKILVADLAEGSAPRQVSDAPPAFLLGPEVVWTNDGKTLLTIADREDANAPLTGRSLDIGIVSLADGAWRPGLALADQAGVTVLQAESADGTILLVPWGAEPAFQEAWRYDLASASLVATLPMAGQGEIVPSPDGRLAVTTLYDAAKGTNVDLLYDLTDDSAPVRQRLSLMPDTHTASHVWSPDGQRIAYLLREGRTPMEGAGGALGIWVWNTESMQTTKVVEAADPSAGPVAWTPDGRYLVYRQVDSAGANAYFALDTTDNTSRQLPLDAASRIIGWISSSSGQ